jgi:hypothetical protein
VNTTGSDLDEEQHEQGAKEDRLHGEEVTGKDPIGLRAKELRPGRSVPSRSGPEPVSPQQSSDRRRSHPDAEAPQLALDPDAAPARVLPGQPKDQVANLRGHRPAPDALRPVSPLAPDQLSVPTKQGRGRDEERAPTLPRQHARRGREQNPVQSPEPGAPGLAGKHLQLMAKDEDLDLTIARFAFGAGEPQQPSQDQVQDRKEDQRMVRNRCDGARSESFRPIEARVSDPLRRRRTWRSSASAAGGEPGGVGGGRSRSPLVVCGQSVSVVEDQSIDWERDLAHGLVVARSPHK